MYYFNGSLNKIELAIKALSHIEPIFFDHPFWKDGFALIDSRKLLYPSNTIFFALKGRQSDGHQYIPELISKGVNRFVVSEAFIPPFDAEVAFFHCADPLLILQEFATYHRASFKLNTIAIGGSNGKTILKEWIAQILQKEHRVVKSPKSYNSQIGVPLSILNISEQHEIGIFEAGISKINEMSKLAKIIQPQIGIFTNIGEAHASGFSSKSEKIREKLNLFRDCKTLIYCKDFELIDDEVKKLIKCDLIDWSLHQPAKIQISATTQEKTTQLDFLWFDLDVSISIPFVNQASVENCIHLILLLLHLGKSIDFIEAQLHSLKEVPMRLEQKNGINNCRLIDDSYNNDLQGLQIALDFQEQKNQKQQPKTLILSDIPEVLSAEEFKMVADLIQNFNIKKLILIGQKFFQFKAFFNVFEHCYFFENADQFIDGLSSIHSFENESILIKGARSFEFERISNVLKKKIHGCRLEINMEALSNNLDVFKNRLPSSTKVMVMVKASAYGSGAEEIAQLLVQKKVDYLGVAYVDEGVMLRNAGIKIPIMVMNTAFHELDLLYSHQLEPVLYSIQSFETFSKFLKNKNDSKPYSVHIELDTGMHRLGFMATDIDQLKALIQENESLMQIASIFSHLAMADDATKQEYTEHQFIEFERMINNLQSPALNHCLFHILNSSGVSSYSEKAYDMVRIGIGMYGYDPSGQIPNLQNACHLKTTISQIKYLKADDYVGYSAKGQTAKAKKVAIIAIGYADGFSRTFGNGQILLKIQDQWVPTIGNICMDMCFVDISSVENVSEGDDVIIFDCMDDIIRLAESADTIAYEILTNVSDRVPRIFYE